MALVMTEDLAIKILDLQHTGKMPCLSQTKYENKFRAKAIACTPSQVIISTDNKCVRFFPLQDFFKPDQKQIQQTKNFQMSLFAIVRSRVFFQQKLD
jgi:hypothetical protein